MQTKSFFHALLFAAVAFTFLTHCSGDKKSDTEADHDPAAHGDVSAPSTGETKADQPQFQVADAFQKQIHSLFTAYVDLKDAFVSSDAGKVRQEAANTNKALSEVDMTLVSGAAHNDWMTYQMAMKTAVETIEKESDIEVQRKAFSTLSNNLYKSIKAFGLGGSTAYYEYCPMAFNDQGAYWLSNAEQIRNPYFGDKMLSCGEVKEKLQ